MSASRTTAVIVAIVVLAALLFGATVTALLGWLYFEDEPSSAVPRAAVSANA